MGIEGLSNANLQGLCEIFHQTQIRYYDLYVASSRMLGWLDGTPDVIRSRREYNALASTALEEAGRILEVRHSLKLEQDAVRRDAWKDRINGRIEKLAPTNGFLAPVGRILKGATNFLLNGPPPAEFRAKAVEQLRLTTTMSPLLDPLPQ